jgi:hypothetical protein
LKIIYKKYDDIIIVSKPYESNKNILYQYKDSNYINIIFIYEKPNVETEISQLKNFEKIIDNKNLDKDNSTIQNDSNDYIIIWKYFNDKKEAAKQQVKEASAVSDEEEEEEPESDEEEEEEPVSDEEEESGAESTDDEKADFAKAQKQINDHKYFKNLEEAINILNILKQSNKILIISDDTVKNENAANVIPDNMNVEQDIINGNYNLVKIDKIDATGLRYNKISTNHDIYIILRPHLDKEQKKYTIRLILKGFQNDVKATLYIDINDFSKLVLNGKPINMNNLSIRNSKTKKNYNSNITISIEDSLLDIVEENLSNVFDSLNIKEDKFTIDNPNKEEESGAESSDDDSAKDFKDDIVNKSLNLSKLRVAYIFDMLEKNNKVLNITEHTYSDANKGQSLTNVNGLYTLKYKNKARKYVYESTKSPNISIYLISRFKDDEKQYYISLNITRREKTRVINVIDIKELDLSKFTDLLSYNRSYKMSDKYSTFNINFEDSLLDIVEGNLSNVFDSLNEINHSQDAIENPINDNTNVSALNLIQFLINYHDINSNVSALNLIKFLINSHKN